MHHWVIGRGGMLGSSIARGLAHGETEFGEKIRFNWLSQMEAKQQIEAAVELFSQKVGNEPWSIFWCAGVGTVTSTDSVLLGEEIIVDHLLNALLERFKDRNRNGALFFSSSAGAMYAGSESPPMSESTEVVPLSLYGLQKDRLEKLFVRFSLRSGTRVVVGRIANLYGPLQNRDKGQGLITSICQQTLLRKPVNIFVGLDTVRNYIYVDDAAKIAIRVMSSIHLMPEATVQTKVVCSLVNHSVSSVLKDCESVFGFAPNVVQLEKANKSAYPRDLRMKSKCELNADDFDHTPLVVGISRVWQSLLRDQQRGLLVGVKK